MSVIPDRALRQTSISQVEVASHDQLGGCMLRWWFNSAMGLKPDQGKSAREGVAGHALFPPWFQRSELPKKHTLMGKAVTGAIVKGKLPKPGPDLMCELRFDGQEQLYPDRRCHCGHLPADHAGKKHDGACSYEGEGHDPEDCECELYSAEWIPLDREQTLWHAGLPWEGFIDLTFRRGDVPTVLDHKFFSPADPREFEDPYAFLKKPEELIKTVQMPMYVMNMRRYWPDAKRWEIAHHQVNKKGVDSRITSTIVSTDQVLERADRIAKTVERMKVHALVTDQTDVPFNKNSCRTWGGCPHQSICHRFNKENAPMSDPDFDLSEGEAAIFGVKKTEGTPPPADDDVPPLEDDDVPPLDEPTLTEAQIATAKANDAAVAADKAKTKKIAEAKAAAAKAAAELAALEKEASEPAPVQPPPKKAEAPAPTGVLSSDAPKSDPTKAAEGSTPPPPPAPAKGKKATPPAATTKPPEPTALAPAAFAGEPESERAARAAMDASKKTTPAPKLEGVPVAKVALGGVPTTREALAALLENLAVLVRAAT